jgi:hypothetical protein
MVFQLGPHPGFEVELIDIRGHFVFDIVPTTLSRVFQNKGNNEGDVDFTHEDIEF